MSKKKNQLFVEGRKEKSAPRDHRLLSFGKLMMPNVGPRDGFFYPTLIVQESAILLIKWLRPKGLKVCSFVEMYAEFKNQALKKIGWYTKMLYPVVYPRGRQFLKIALKWGTL